MSRQIQTRLSLEELRNTIESVRGEAKVSGISFIVELPTDLHCEADEERVNDHALRVINRAMNRMMLHPPSRDARIWVRVEESAGEFHLSVHDNSPAIDRLFASQLSQESFGDWYYEFDSVRGNLVTMSLPLVSPSCREDLVLSLAR